MRVLAESSITEARVKGNNRAAATASSIAWVGLGGQGGP